MSREPALTTTSYAILGLLAVRPWSTYELARQMDRSLGRIWPRAQSKIYEEPKKLVRHGLARAEKQSVGRRPRTVYAITPEGRGALAAWLHEPGAGPALESEQHLKVFFADSGTKADTRATLHALRAWAVERNQENLTAARGYAAGEGAFPQRAAQTLLVGRFLTDYYRLVAEWADWAATVVEQWPDEPRDATADPDELAETVRRAAWSEADAEQGTRSDKEV
ncbi:PadR family transcriptional regulator [Streptomyces sp. HUCO-GS316]|uniref:PadR family transcriptional regulator n=1 Tax=Streptomyces sp. HUCO-GS316 TaxID=2692198 RepID=UPI00136ACD3D|nr:PadR family transcriptional regulator [Streptomyces sp. HUCO-GS316]MXM66455.1 PadR family transcriptional regulator [Streptomyces sp. HUCO-GS316]